MRRAYISIWRRPITRTLPGTQIRDLSLRSTSVHIVSSDSSLDEVSRARICAASPMGSRARAIVPEIGQVSTRAVRNASAVHAHVHLGGGADQILRVAQVHQEAVGRRIALAEPQEQLGRR